MTDRQQLRDALTGAEPAGLARRLAMVPRRDTLLPLTDDEVQLVAHARGNLHDGNACRWCKEVSWALAQ